MIPFDILKLELNLSELEEQTLQESFWADSVKSSKILSKIKELKTKCSTYTKLKNELENLSELTKLVIVDNDEQIAKDIIKTPI